MNLSHQGLQQPCTCGNTQRSAQAFSHGIGGSKAENEVRSRLANKDSRQ